MKKIDMNNKKIGVKERDKKKKSRLTTVSNDKSRTFFY